MDSDKVYEAQDVLRAVGLPSRQQNEISALTFLVLAQLSEAIKHSVRAWAFTIC